MEKQYWNAIWISDVHLGTRDCKASSLLSFLKNNRCRQLYLVGDIIDGWRISTSKWFWPSEHNKVLRQLLRKAEKEHTKIFYIPGNHDEFLKEYLHDHQLQMGNIHVRKEMEHTCATGQKLWIVHGDLFDGVTRHHRLVLLLGDIGYGLLIRLNIWLNRARHLLKMPYWSLSASIKLRLKSASSYITDFEQSVAHEAKRRGYDGVICGHIHHANQRFIEGIGYYNCGDWVDSCTALAEDKDGGIHIIRWNREDTAESNVIPLKLSA